MRQALPYVHQTISKAQPRTKEQGKARAQTEPKENVLGNWYHNEWYPPFHAMPLRNIPADKGNKQLANPKRNFQIKNRQSKNSKPPSSRIKAKHPSVLC